MLSMARSVKGSGSHRRGDRGDEHRTEERREGARHGDARRERWRAHREARREEFVEATIRAVATHGPDVGMDEIAAEAGVSKPVLYRYFGDKADLYLAVGEWATDLLLRRLRPALDEPGSARERIRRIVDAYVATLDDYPALYRFVVGRTFVDRRIDDPVAANKTLISDAVSALIGGQVRAFGLDSRGVEVLSYSLVGMVQSAGDWWLQRQAMSRGDLTDHLARLLWHAIDGFLRDEGFMLDPDEPLPPTVGSTTGESD